MNKVYGYDATQAFNSAKEKIVPGGHVCKIVSATVDKAASNGADALKLALEIAEGSEFDGIFNRQFQAKRATNPEAKWPCIYRQQTLAADGACSPYFKGLITAIEKSNPGYSFTASWDERTLSGKRVGMIFREEEFIGNDGDVLTTVKPAFACTVEDVQAGVPVPAVKRLARKPAFAAPAFNAFTEITGNDDLPFEM